MRKRILRDCACSSLSITVFLLTFLVSSSSHAASVTFAWDPSPSSVDGYRLKYSANSSSPPYQNELDAGTSLTITVSSLLPGNSYAFAVTAYQGTLESSYSNQVGVSVSPQDIAFLDNDFDAMPDEWERSHFKSLQQDASSDFDGDGVTNLNEYYQGTDPSECPWRVSDSSAEACVSSSFWLQKCLTEAQEDGHHNTLLLQSGYYSGNFSYVSGAEESYDLLIIGGYDAGCSESQYLPGATTLDGEETGTVLTIDTLSTSASGNTWLEGLQFTNGINPAANGPGGCLAVHTRNGRVNVLGNLVNNCEAYEGGGVFIQNNTGEVVFSNNIIHDNTADTAGGGLAISTTSAALTLLQNTISQNAASFQGGGLGVWIAGNSGTLDLTNNIIWANALTPNPAADCGNDVYIDSDASPDGSYAPVDMAHNLVDLASGVCVTDPSFGPDATNINQDPLFLSPENNVFLLGSGSPAIDAGTGTHPEAPPVDVEGDPRDGTPDLGADEYVASKNPVVISPNGGEVLSSDAQMTVEWALAAGAASYRLSYSVDQGQAWTVIETVTGATSLVWTVPALGADSNRCLIRVEALGSQGAVSGMDTSDRAFSINAVPVQLLSPNGGEALDSATAFTIRWSRASGASYYRLHYSQNDGATWYLIGTAYNANSTSYAWVVPILLADTGRARVRVQAYSAEDVLLNSDASDGVFSIKTIDPDTAPAASSGGGGGGGGGAGTGAGIAGGGIAGAFLLFLFL